MLFVCQSPSIQFDPIRVFVFFWTSHFRYHFYIQKIQHFVAINLLLLALPTILAVVTNGDSINNDADRRESTIDAGYGPPPAPVAELVLPSAIYGQPATHIYPAQPSDLPPPPLQTVRQVPHKEYGVPVQQYGPPAVHVEYGTPADEHFRKPHQHQHHQQQQQQNNRNQHHEVSFFEQVAQHFGTPKAVYGAPAAVYGPPSIPQHAHTVYGPPRAQPSHSSRPPKPIYGPPPKPAYGPPSQHLVYGPPKPINFIKPKAVYGPPTQYPIPVHHPAHVYGPPPKRPQKPQQVYGPPKQHHHHHKPATVYGPPPQVHQPQLAQQYELPLPSPAVQHITPTFNALTLVEHQSGSAISGISGSAHSNGHQQSSNSGSRCEGWRPIAGPAIPYSSSEEQIHLQQSTDDSTFGIVQEDHQQYQQELQQQQFSSAAGNGIVAESLSTSIVSGNDGDGLIVGSGLQLPVNNAVNFYHDTAAGLHGKHSNSINSASGTEVSY